MFEKLKYFFLIWWYALPIANSDTQKLEKYSQTTKTQK